MKKIVILFFLVFSGVLCYAEQYEYRVEYRWSKYSTMQELTKFCNELATEGWRLVEVTSENSQMYMLFFERDIDKMCELCDKLKIRFYCNDAHFKER